MLNPLLQRRIKTLQEYGYYVDRETVMYPDTNAANNGLNAVFVQEMGAWPDNERGRREALSHFAHIIAHYRSLDLNRALNNVTAEFIIDEDGIVVWPHLGETWWRLPRNRRTNDAPTIQNPNSRHRW